MGQLLLASHTPMPDILMLVTHTPMLLDTPTLSEDLLLTPTVPLSQLMSQLLPPPRLTLLLVVLLLHPVPLLTLDFHTLLDSHTLDLLPTPIALLSQLSQLMWSPPELNTLLPTPVLKNQI